MTSYYNVLTFESNESACAWCGCGLPAGATRVETGLGRFHASYARQAGAELLSAAAPALRNALRVALSAADASPPGPPPPDKQKPPIASAALEGA